MRHIGAIAIGLLIATLICMGQDVLKPGGRVILPNPKLVRCSSLECSELWETKAPKPGDIYPLRIEVGLPGQACPFGVSAVYDKAVPFDYLEAAIESRYGKGEPKHWTKARLSFWEVANDFTIVLDEADEGIAKARHVDVGTKELFIDDARTPTGTCNQR